MARSRFSHAGEHFQDFLTNTSLHGLQYTASSSRTVSIFWLLLFLSSAACAVFLIERSFVNWVEHPVLTTTGDVAVMNLDFPAVTVCPVDVKNRYSDWTIVEYYIQLFAMRNVAKIYVKFVFDHLMTDQLSLLSRLLSALETCSSKGCLIPMTDVPPVDCACVDALADSFVDTANDDVLAEMESFRSLTASATLSCTLQAWNAADQMGRDLIARAINNTKVANSTDPKSRSSSFRNVSSLFYAFPNVSSLSSLSEQAANIWGSAKSTDNLTLKLDRYVIEDSLSRLVFPSAVSLMSRMLMTHCVKYAVAAHVAKALTDANFDFGKTRLMSNVFLAKGSEAIQASSFLTLLRTSYPTEYAQLISQLNVSASASVSDVQKTLRLTVLASLSTISQTAALSLRTEAVSAIPQCSFNGKSLINASQSGSDGEVPVCGAFERIMTDLGACLAFNIRPLQDIFKTSRWLNSSGTKAPSIHIKRNGLTFVVDTDAAPLGLDVGDAAMASRQALRVTLHASDALPKMSGINYGYDVDTGKGKGIMHVTLSFDVEKRLSTAAFLELPFSKRQCFKSGEKTLQWVKTYSRSQCLAECARNYSSSKYGCLSEGIISMKNLMRLPWSGPNVACNLTDEAIDAEVFERKECTCLDTCDGFEYNAAISCVLVDPEFPNDLFFFDRKKSASATSLSSRVSTSGSLADYLLDTGDTLVAAETKLMLAMAFGKGRVSRAMDRANKNIVIISVIFNSKSGKEATSDVRATWMDMVAGVGGTLGLFVGFSILSVFEFAQCLVAMAAGCFCPRKSNDVNDQEEESNGKRH